MLLLACTAPPPPESELGRVSNGAVLDHLKVVPLEWALVFARLRLAARLSRHGSASVFALVSSAGGRPWRELVEQSALAFAKLLPDKLDGLPLPSGRMALWEQFWLDFPAAWASLIKLANRRVELQPVHARRCLLFAGLVGDPDPPDSSDDLFLCSVCGRWFPTAAGCKIHAAKQHGHSSEASLKSRLDGTECPVCFTEFHTRARLVQHLRARPDRANACRDVFDLGVL